MHRGGRNGDAAVKEGCGASEQTQNSISSGVANKPVDYKVLPVKERNERLAKWFQEQGILVPTDTVAAALEAMYVSRSTSAFVVNHKTGEPVGVVTLMGLCQWLILQEGSEMCQQQETQKALEKQARR
jgi:hypothetical protein